MPSMADGVLAASSPETRPPRPVHREPVLALKPRDPAPDLQGHRGSLSPDLQACPRGWAQAEGWAPCFSTACAKEGDYRLSIGAHPASRARSALPGAGPLDPTARELAHRASSGETE